MNKNIVLIGMMGSGKTSVASRLVEKTEKLTLIDIDEEIVKRECCTINDIFREKGENYFRTIEAKIVEQYSTATDKIISTGGGVVEFEKNIMNLKKNGILFYLQTDTDVLSVRLKNDSSRPLLNKKNIAEMLEELLQKRERRYLEADFIINTSELSIEEIANEVLKHYGK